MTAEGSRGTTLSCCLCGSNHSSKYAVPEAEPFWSGVPRSKLYHWKVKNMKTKVIKWKMMENESFVWALKKSLLIYIKIHVLQVQKYQFQHRILCILSKLIGCILLVYFGLHLCLISGPFSCIWVRWYTVIYVHAVKLSCPPVRDCIQIPCWEWILAHSNSHSQSMEKVILQWHKPYQTVSAANTNKFWCLWATWHCLDSYA